MHQHHTKANVLFLCVFFPKYRYIHIYLYITHTQLLTSGRKTKNLARVIISSVRNRRYPFLDC